MSSENEEKVCTLYYIDKPYISSGLKRTYHKRLEVAECTVKLTTRNTLQGPQQYYQIKKIEAVHVCGKKGWQRKETTSVINKMYRYIDPPFGRLNKIGSNADGSATLYATLEAAQASKLILVQKMAETYKQAIQDLKDLFKRNIPDIEEPLASLLEDHPDLFI